MTIPRLMGNLGIMKTTLDIHDELLTRAKQYAQETRRPLRAVVEELTKVYEAMECLLAQLPSLDSEEVRNGRANTGGESYGSR